MLIIIAAHAFRFPFLNFANLTVVNIAIEVTAQTSFAREELLPYCLSGWRKTITGMLRRWCFSGRTSRKTPYKNLLFRKYRLLINMDQQGFETKGRIITL
jgi:hypothetical protein